MDPEEVMAYIDSLPPDQQQEAIDQMGLGQINQVPGAFGGGIPGNFSPSLSMGQYNLGTMNQLPPDIEYGEVMPFGLDEQGQAYNAMQDLGALTLDPAIAMYAGPGAFSSTAFNPTPIPIGDPIDLAGSRYVGMMANTGPGYQSYLAKKIADGMNPGQAVASMWQAVQTPDENLDPEALAQKQAIVASLPPVVRDPSAPTPPGTANLAGDFSTPEGQAANADVTGITTFANDLFTKLAEDEQVGYTDPQTGLKYAGVYQQPSPLAEKFQEYGIPLPNESYLDPQWLPQQDQGYLQNITQQEAQAQDAIEAARVAKQQTQAGFNQLQRAWNETGPSRRAAESGPQPTGPADNQYNLSPGSMQAAQTAADLDWQTLSEGGGTVQDFADRYATRPRLGDFIPDEGPNWLAQKNIGEPSQAEQAATADYTKAYDEWAAEQKKRLADEAQKRGATATQGTAAPFAVTGNNQVLGTYDFGDYNAPQQQALGSILGTIAQAKGYNNVDVGALSPGWQSSWQSAVDNANQQWFDANQQATDIWNQTSPDELQGARMVGTALAMTEAGRSPMEDVLMQRSMGRQMISPYRGY